MKPFQMILCCALLFNICAYSQTVAPPEHRERDANIIRELETRFSQAVAAKDPDALVALYADNGALYDENNPIVRGKNRIREYWKADFARQGVTILTRPGRVEVAEPGDLAWAHGLCRITTDASLNPVRYWQFEYALIYKKLPDGSWKIWADCVNSGVRNSLLPPPPKRKSPYVPLAPLIGLGCAGGCLWFTFGMPFMTVIHGWKSLRSRKWTTGFFVSVSMWIVFFLVAALFWRQLSANYWNLTLRHAFIAAGDTARYGNPVEDTAESVLISWIVLSMFSGLAAGFLAWIGCRLRIRRPALGRIDVS